jgi:hypothetical protein
MPPLHAPTAVATATDVDAEAPYVRAHHGQVFLDLIRDARLRQRTAAIGTVRRQRYVDGFVDVRWRLMMRVSAMTPAHPTARLPRVRRRRAFRERRGLSFPRATHRIEFLLQPLILATEALYLAAQPFDLLILRVWRGRFRRRLFARRAHAPFMPDPRSKYKRKGHRLSHGLPFANGCE